MNRAPVKKQPAPAPAPKGSRVARFVRATTQTSFRLLARTLDGSIFSESFAFRMRRKYDVFLAIFVFAFSGAVRDFISPTWFGESASAAILALEAFFGSFVTAPRLATVLADLLGWLFLGWVLHVAATLIVNHPNWVLIQRRDYFNRTNGAQELFPARRMAASVISALVGTVLLRGQYSLGAYAWFLLGLYWLRTSQRNVRILQTDNPNDANRVPDQEVVLQPAASAEAFERRPE